MDNDSPVSFGYKLGWFAIRSTDRDAVLRSLQLSDPREVTWKAGIDAVYGNAYNLLKTPLSLRSTVFISPAVNGWTFIVGDWTMRTGDEQGVREVERLIARISAEFGEVQAFATHRVVEYHHWMLARNGALVRSLAYIGESGEVLADSGEPTPVEIGFDWYPLRRDDSDLDEEEPEDEGTWPDEEAVMKVAGEWSINPQLLETFPPAASRGVLARTPAAPRPGRDAEKEAVGRPWWRFWGRREPKPGQ